MAAMDQTAVDALIALLDLEPIEVNIFRGRAPTRTASGCSAARSPARRSSPRPAPSRTCRSTRSTPTSCTPATRPLRSSTRSTASATRGASSPAGCRPSSTAGPSSASRPRSSGPEEGFDHQMPMPDRPARPRDARRTSATGWRRGRTSSAPGTTGPGPSTPATATGSALTTRRPGPMSENVWFRANGALPDDPVLHTCVVTYASDMTVLDTSLRPHGGSGIGDVFMASLDHAMWFHRPFRADEWLLYAQDTPSASGGRGLGRGLIYTTRRACWRPRWCRRASSAQHDGPDEPTAVASPSLPSRWQSHWRSRSSPRRRRCVDDANGSTGRSSGRHPDRRRPTTTHRSRQRTRSDDSDRHVACDSRRSRRSTSRPRSIARAGTGRASTSAEQAGRGATPRAGTATASRSTTTPVLDITGAVASPAASRACSGWRSRRTAANLFVNYTDGNDDGATVIAAGRSTRLEAANGPTRRAASEILRVDQPFANHNGGNIVFGPDGMPLHRVRRRRQPGRPRRQRPESRRPCSGKILRIDPSSARRRIAPTPFRADNPFVGDAGAPSGDLGLRAAQPVAVQLRPGRPATCGSATSAAASGRRSIILPADGRRAGSGANLGWNLREGAHDTDERRRPPDDLVDPVFEYGHDEGSSITGGFVYRGAAIPALSGVYLFCDYATSTLRGLRATDGVLEPPETSTRPAADLDSR